MQTKLHAAHIATGGRCAHGHCQRRAARCALRSDGRKARRYKISGTGGEGIMEFTPTEVILKRAKAAASCPALRDTEAKKTAPLPPWRRRCARRPRPFWRKKRRRSRGLARQSPGRHARPPRAERGTARGHGSRHRGRCCPCRTRSAGRWTNSSVRTAFASASAACRWALSPSSMRAARTSRRTPPRLR